MLVRLRVMDHICGVRVCACVERYLTYVWHEHAEIINTPSQLVLVNS